MVEATNPEVGRGLRLAELLGALSLATDLAHEEPPESALRDAILSVAFARHLGVTGQELSDTYYLALLRHLGCTGAAEEQGKTSAGNDSSLRHTFGEADYGDRPELLRLAVSDLARGTGAANRARAMVGFLTTSPAYRRETISTVCETSARLAHRLGAGPEVSRALSEVFARWDGKVFSTPPAEGISRIARLTHLVHVSHVNYRRGGLRAAADVVRRRRGGEFDPTLADAFLGVYPDLFSAVDEGSVWDAALDTEPRPRRLVPQSGLEELTTAIADFTDVKSRFTFGHSRRVGELAEAAAADMGLSADDRSLLRMAGHVHDLGGVSVPQRVWTKPGGLNRPEHEAVRLHAYHTERILSVCRSLQPLGAVAGLHHERMDGSGYHRGITAAGLSQAARILAATAVHQSLVEERSWRPAFDTKTAGNMLLGEASEGKLDRAAVMAVLAAAGDRRAPRRVAWPAGLTDREVDVLRLLATGRSNRAIATLLNISVATVHTHAINLYAKTEVHTRAGIALFAIENDLLEAGGDRPFG